MSKSKNYRRKSDAQPKVPSNTLIARYWRAAEDDDAAFDKFDSVITALLDQEKMTPARIEAILTRLSPEDVSPLTQAIEYSACNRMLPATLSDGTPAVVTLRTFGIPISGLVKSIEDEIATRYTEIAKGLRWCGFSPDRSSVVLLPICLPVTALAEIGPGDLRAISTGLFALLQSREDLSREGTDTSSNTPYQRALSIGRDLAASVKGNSIDKSNKPASCHRQNPSHTAACDFAHDDAILGQRFLIGIEVTQDAIKDSSAILEYAKTDVSYDNCNQETPSESDEMRGVLFQADDSDEAIEDLDIVLTSWCEYFSTESPKRDYHIGYPTPWEDLRQVMLMGRVEQDISMAIAMEEKAGYQTKVSHLSLLAGDNGLEITAMNKSRPITRIDIPKELLIVGGENFISSLLETYPVESIESDFIMDRYNLLL